MTNLDLTRNEAAAELAATEAFPQGIVVLAIEPKAILSMIDEALSKLGVAVHVLPPEPLEALQVDEEHPIIFFPRVELRVRVIERVSLNEVPMHARELRDLVMSTLHGWRPSAPGVESPLLLAPKPQLKAEFPGQVIYDVIFHFASHLHPIS